jgi:predicted transcriptional regulator
MKKSKTSTSLTVRLPNDIMGALDEMATKLGQTKSDIAKEAIAGYILILRKESN